ncbi:MULTISPECIES: GNAT family N-acetyltransferase [unclassified Roseovarius]|uniref:GNAT family N-acetyltransferase n=1 Tax=unclassified Roseovarius TaxID=2614913 RepID=UPI00273E9CD0|nr:MULTISPECIES: GNAT family N-acetyltransferase [unclassified Roseovarius]
MSLTLNIPRLETDRLILRGPDARDFEPIANFYADESRSWGFGGPMRRDEAWRWLATSIGHWALHGYGFFTMELKDSGTACGLTGLWNPEGWPEPELGWVVFEGFEGKGLAREGAERARLWAYTDLGLETLTSNIKPGNHRSVALAERMGARFERSYENVHLGEDHLYRHPAPADLGLNSDNDGSPEAYA